MSTTAVTAPRVSVIIPLYESHHTLPRCLASLKAQTFTGAEIVLVDSSPHEKCGAVAASVLPTATYIHVERQMNAQAARNLGVTRASGSVFVFTDPDIYPAADWLERLVQAAGNRSVVLGSIACFGHRWIDRGVHLCKFHICLPGARTGPVPLGWSGNLLVQRELFEQLGGWDPKHTQGDSVFTARVRAAGHDLWFEPCAVVEHDHEGIRFRSFVRERYRRGIEFASMEAAGLLDTGEPARSPARNGPVELLLLPLRAVRRTVGIGLMAARARALADYVVTVPVVVSGVAAWYSGLWTYQWRRLVNGGDRARS